jgi:hypothetical protein
VQLSVPASASITLTGEGNGVMNKNISGYGGLIKSGAGTWTRNGTTKKTLHHDPKPMVGKK